MTLKLHINNNPLPKTMLDIDPTREDIEIYADYFADTNWMNEYIQESYWEDNFSTRHCLEAMLASAKADNLELIGLDEFDYDTFFYNAYDCAEKGLS